MKSDEMCTMGNTARSKSNENLKKTGYFFQCYRASYLEYQWFTETLLIRILWFKYWIELCVSDVIHKAPSFRSSWGYTI